MTSTLGTESRSLTGTCVSPRSCQTLLADDGPAEPVPRSGRYPFLSALRHSRVPQWGPENRAPDATADGAPPPRLESRNEPLGWGKPASAMKKEEEARYEWAIWTGNSSLHSSRRASSSLPLEILFSPICSGREATHPGCKPTTHSPASAPPGTFQWFCQTN